MTGGPSDPTGRPPPDVIGVPGGWPPDVPGGVVPGPVDGPDDDELRPQPVGMEMILVSSVTAPLRASTRPPGMLVPVVSVMLVRAIRFPRNVVPVPSVAELPTCHQTSQPSAPLMRLTVAALAVVSALPIWKMKRAFLVPWPSRVRGPVSCA